MYFRLNAGDVVRFSVIPNWLPKVLDSMIESGKCNLRREGDEYVYTAAQDTDLYYPVEMLRPHPGLKPLTHKEMLAS